MDARFEGRYPVSSFTGIGKLGATPFSPEDMTLETRVYDDEVVFRIDDGKHLDFWMQISVNKEELLKILQGEKQDD